MRTRLLTAIAAGVVAAAMTACSDDGAPAPPAPAGGSVWVADEGADALSVIDAATNKVVTTLTGLPKPHNVQVGHDGVTVYAVSSGNMVLAIDATKYAVAAVAPTGSAPAHVIEAPNGKVYVTNAGDGTVSVYRTPGLQPAGQIELGGMPHGLRAAPGGSVIVVANTADGLVNLIDPTTDRVLASVPVGARPAQVAVTADGRYAYAGVSEPPSVVKVDVAARRVVASARVPASPVQLYLTPTEQTLLSADQGTPEKPGNTLSLIDTAAMTTRGRVTTGSGPHGVVVDNSGTRAWVTNVFDDIVSVVDIVGRSVLATVPVRTEPNGISYSPRPPAASGQAIVTLNLPAPATDTDQHSGHGG